MTAEAGGRLFVGLAIPDDLRDGLRRHLEATVGDRLPGRAVPTENWHLTLRFLGATDADRHRRLAAGLRTIAMPAFELSLAALGAFPRPARANVLWIGVGDGPAELRMLAAAVDSVAVTAGFAAESMAYSPHLTLSRLRPPADVRPFVERTPAFGGRMAVDEFALFRTHLRSPTPRYEIVERFPLLR